MSKTPAKPRLGRGLSSLISSTELPIEAEVPAGSVPTPGPANPPAVIGSPAEIPLAAISPNPHQPRRQMDQTALAELAASLKSTGLIQPIVVRQMGDGQYQLIAGERRWRAAQLAGLPAIPAIIKEVDPFTQAQMALVENIQRADLNPIERATGYDALMRQLGLTQNELAVRLGEERSTIANYLRLLELAEPVRQMLRDGKLSLGHAKLIAGVPDVLEQQKLAETVIAQDLSVRNLERMLTAAPKEPEKREQPPAPTAHFAELERSITSQLGMRVQVRPSAKQGKGKLVIHYTDLDQFDALMGKLGVKAEQT